MGKYYCLIAGLPEISLDDHKLPFTVAEFSEELDNTLTKKDKKIVDLFFLKFDNKNLLTQLKYPEFDPDPRGHISSDEFREMITRLKEEGIPTENNRIPPYIIEFIKIYLEAQEKGEKPVILWEDQLAALYYDYAMKSHNTFVATWFELSLNINNMFTAISARKYELDRNKYIVGTNDVADALRTSNARDFGLGLLVDYWTEIQRITEETDLYIRERKTDLLKWEWLEENSFFKTFEVESVFVYLVKLDMLERWVTLDKEKGEKSFRELVGAMKKGSESALEEFKRNNTK